VNPHAFWKRRKGIAPQSSAPEETLLPRKIPLFLTRGGGGNRHRKLRTPILTDSNAPPENPPGRHSQTRLEVRENPGLTGFPQKKKGKTVS